MRSYKSDVKQGPCNISTQLEEKGTKPKYIHITQGTKKITIKKIGKTKVKQEKYNSSPHPGPVLKPSAIEMMRKN